MGFNGECNRIRDFRTLEWGSGNKNQVFLVEDTLEHDSKSLNYFEEKTPF